MLNSDINRLFFGGGGRGGVVKEAHVPTYRFTSVVDCTILDIVHVCICMAAFMVVKTLNGYHMSRVLY